MASPPKPASGVEDITYAAHSRFTLELEFVQSLSNPAYLNHLAATKVLQDPAFVNYLSYLQYFAQPEYVKYLSYPGPTLRVLELLQEERFRAEVLDPAVVEALGREWREGWIKHAEGRG